MSGGQTQMVARIAGPALPVLSGHALAMVLADLAYRRFWPAAGGLAGSPRTPTETSTGMPQGNASGTITPVQGRGLRAAAAAQRPEVGPPRNGVSLTGDGGERPALISTLRGDAARTESRKSQGCGHKAGGVSASSQGCDTAKGAKPGTLDSRERPAHCMQRDGGESPHPNHTDGRPGTRPGTAVSRCYDTAGEPAPSTICLAVPCMGEAKDNGRGPSGLMQIESAPGRRESAGPAATTAPAVQRSTADLAGKASLCGRGRRPGKYGSGAEQPGGATLQPRPGQTAVIVARDSSASLLALNGRQAPSTSAGRVLPTISADGIPAVCKTRLQDLVPGGAFSPSSLLTFPAAGDLHARTDRTDRADLTNKEA